MKSAKKCHLVPLEVPASASIRGLTRVMKPQTGRPSRRSRYSLLLSGIVGCVAAATAPAGAQTAFERVQGYAGDEVATSIERTADGGFITVGNYAPPSGDPAIILHKLDRYGQVMWATIYDNPGTRETAQSVRPTRDGGYIIGGETDAVTVGGDQFGILVFKVDSMGSCIGPAKTFIGTPHTGVGGTVIRERTGYSAPFVSGCTPLTPSHGGYVVTGRRVVGTSMRAVLVVLDACLNELGTTEYRDGRAAYATNNYMTFNDVRELPDRSFVVGGWTNVGATLSREALIARIGPNGATGVVYGNLNEDNPGEAIDLLPDNSALLVGPHVDETNPLLRSFYVKETSGGAAGSMRSFTTFLDPRSVRWSIFGEAVIAGKTSIGGTTDAALLRVIDLGPFTSLLANRYGSTAADGAEEAILAADATFALAGKTAIWLPGGQQYVVKTDRQGAACTNLPFTVSQNPEPGRMPIPILDEQISSGFGQSLTLLCQRDFIESEPPCRTGCYTPTVPMTLWLPMDEPTGTTAWNVKAPSRNGADINGPVHVTGAVGLARSYNGSQFTEVPRYDGIDFAENKDFSIDAWVKRSSNTTATQMIVDKRCVGQGTDRYGYAFYLGGINGRTLMLELADGPAGGGAGFTVYQPNTQPATLMDIPSDNNWHYVAVTVQRGTTTQQQAITFYRYSPQQGSFSAPHAGGPVRTKALFNLQCPTNLRVGASTIGSGSQFFTGSIDEVEIFPYVLPWNVVYGIGHASDGKCKSQCRQLRAFFCRTNTQVTIYPQVCNYNTIPTSFTVTFNSLPVGAAPGCGISGPTSFSPAIYTTPELAPGQCHTFPVQITRPPNMTAQGYVSCFEYFVSNNNGDAPVISCMGRLIDARNWCFFGQTGEQVDAVPGAPVNLGQLGLQNTQGQTPSRPFRVRALDPEGNPDLLNFSLNGLAPGAAVTGTAGGAPNQITTFNLQFELTQHDPGRTYTLSVEVDHDGTGAFEPVFEIPVHSIDVLPCIAEFNGDGAVTSQDYFDFLTAFFNSNADVNGDGQTNSQDFFDFLAAFFAGC
ncbi:MAG: LamG-like jellyroll fold domain-containing protein [Vicinamibacterales bacterium]